MGDFNAKVGRDQTTKSVMGMHGIGERNERGDRLLDFCCVNNLCITNSWFKQAKESRCWTWESPDQQTHNQIDYILVSKKLMASVRNSRAFPSADCGSDHQLVMANKKLKLKVKRPTARIMKRDVGRLVDDTVQMEYKTKIEEKWQTLIDKPVDSIEDEWNRFKDAIQETAKEILGYRDGSEQKEWLSDVTLRLMADRRKYKILRRQGPDMAKHHNYLCRIVKKSAKEDKEKYIQELC
jgi:hypothetical protein